MLMILGSVLLFVAAVFGLVILINAFKESAGQGLLCMFVPFYILYYAFARYSSPKKALVVSGWLGANVVGVSLVVVGSLLAANDAVAAFEGELQNMPEMGQAPVGGGAAAADTDDATIMSCNLSAQPGRVCNQYSIGGSYTQQNAEEHCEMIQVGQDDKLGLSDGPCPMDNAIAKCEPRFGDKVTVYYQDDGVDNDAAMDSMENLCVGTFSRL